ncbi:nuclear transport factor 2 family protein [Branchiibius cervicis]|uniref:Nuclear transport factor 2 family protein n=1 Tax=Branchiibius cervicis TaxID=908252 RepID=A0ABW2ANI5_9MICO
MTEQIDVPAPVSAFVAAINEADTEGFVALFLPDGLISDWGTEYRGSQRVRQWAGSDAIGAGAQMQIRSAKTEGAVTTVRFDWRSSVFTGESTGIFTVDGEHLASFVIPPEH